MKRVSRLVLSGEVAHRHEADVNLKGPGTAVTVRRGPLRSIVISCPDGCGDILTINLDPRAGPAWRLYTDHHGASLFPSVWRDNGCESHFIIWRSRIYWCDWKEDVLAGEDIELEGRVRDLLDSTFKGYFGIAELLGEVPWSVLVACNRLAVMGQAVAGTGTNRGKFRRR